MRNIRIYLFFLIVLFVFGIHHMVIGDPAPQRSVSPMMREIQIIVEQEETALVTLQEDLANAPTEQNALQALRAIGQQKQDTEVAILRVQKRYAQEAGETEAVARIEQAISRILDPQPLPPSQEARKERDGRRTGGADHE